jgi:phage repressor protein C with HTH and peptisase S24 domain
METTVKQRLLDFIYHLRVSQKDFCDALGVSNSYVHSIRKSIAPEKLSAISAQYPELNIEWLLTGKGEMLNSGRAVSGGVVVTNNGHINGNNNMTVTHTHSSSAEQSDEDVPMSEVEEIPVVPRKLYNETNVDVLEYVNEHNVNTSPSVLQFPSFDIWWYVYTDSMQCEYMPGDKLALRAYPKGFEKIRNGRDYVIQTNLNGMTLCRLTRCDGGYIASYENKKYSDDFIPEEDVVNIFKIMGLLRIKE